MKLSFKLGLSCFVLIVAAGVCVAQADVNGYQCSIGEMGLRPDSKLDLGDITKKVIYVPRLRSRRLAKNLSESRIVKVHVVIDINSGKVVWAQAISDDPVVRAEVGKVVCQARFTPTFDVDGRVSGFIRYRLAHRRSGLLAEWAFSENDGHGSRWHS